ncbi:MAG: tetratricopeptide repeat protein [Bryobacteraceae bacterium]
MVVDLTASRLHEAVAFHQSGDLDRAIVIYREVLAAAPAYPDALHLLGAALSATGQHEEAIASLRHAIEVRRYAPAYWSNLGLALSRAGKPEEAAEAYRQSLAIQPGHGPTLAKLGRVLDAAGQSRDAIEILEQALAAMPEDPDAHNALGAAYMNAGRGADARHHFERAWTLDPSFEEAQQNLANLFRVEGDRAVEGGRWPEAATAYRNLAAMAPSDPDAHFRLALALSASNDAEGARQRYELALALRPDHPQTCNNLAHLRLAMGDGETALALLEKALALDPEYTEARYNLGVALQMLDRPAEARSAYEQIVAADPGHADSWNNLGSILLGERRGEDAEANFRRALEASPRHIDARWNLALSQLARGDWTNGWQGYEARLEQKKFSHRPFAAPRWNGEPLEGRSLCVWAEQGLGDTIQFARYLRALPRENVIFECQPNLAPLLACSTELPRVVARAAASPEADLHLPLLSLPGILGAQPGTIPAPLGNWQLPADHIERWHAALAEFAGRRVGICWGGSPHNWDGRKRSMPLAIVARLGEVPGVRLFSLQRGPQACEQDPRVTVLEDESCDILDTAAILSQLDLVVSIDTMIAHLAASLGTPTLTLLPYASDWRWMNSEQATPWYPAMRLFRQPSPGDWTSVVDRIACALASV